jgi:hypothetical protein
MGGSFSRWRHAVPAALLAIAGLADCSCEPDVVVADCFADPAFDDHENDSDQLHRYANGATAVLFVTGGAVDESTTVTSSDESVFLVERATFGRVERFLASDVERLAVELRGVGSGEAELVVGNADGPLVSRTLSFVDVDRVVLTRLYGLPPVLERPIDTSALALGPEGATFLLHYGDDVGDDIEGNGVFALADELVNAEDPAAVVRVQDEGGTYRNPRRDVLHISSVGEETRLAFSLAGVDRNDAIVVLPAPVGPSDVSAHLVTKDEVRGSLAERGVEVTPELEQLLDNSDDDRVFCQREMCAVQMAVEDTVGRTVFGAESRWADGDKSLSSGDTVTFARGNREHALHARVGGFLDTVVVWASDVEVRQPEEQGDCASFGRSGVSLAALGLLLLRRRGR